MFEGLGCTGYRLPTEADWEYAARAVDATAVTGEHTVEHASTARPAGLAAPNVWGIHDALGNVSEWVWDRYGSGYYAASPKEDPEGPKTGTRRGRRGCSWKDPPFACRPSARFHSDPAERREDVGLRPVLTVH